MDRRRKVTMTVSETELDGQRVFLVQSLVNSIEFRIGDILYPCDVEELLRTTHYTLKVVGVPRQLTK